MCWRVLASPQSIFTISSGISGAYHLGGLSRPSMIKGVTPILFFRFFWPFGAIIFKVISSDCCITLKGASLFCVILIVQGLLFRMLLDTAKLYGALLRFKFCNLREFLDYCRICILRIGFGVEFFILRVILLWSTFIFKATHISLSIEHTHGWFFRFIVIRIFSGLGFPRCSFPFLKVKFTVSSSRRNNLLKESSFLFILLSKCVSRLLFNCSHIW